MTGSPSFAAHDRAGDGFISRDEFDTARAERRDAADRAGRPMRGGAQAPSFEQMDRNGDGRLSPQEFAAAGRQGTRAGLGPGPGAGTGPGAGMGPGAGPRGAPGFSSFDTDGDGYLSQAEFETGRSQRIGERARQGYPMRNLKEVRFAEVETSGDRRIDRAEFAAHQAAERRAPAAGATR